MSKLYRSRDSRVIGGVAGGLGEYFDIDPVIVRLIFIIFGFAVGNGLLAYIIAWILIPENPVSTMGQPDYAPRAPMGSKDRQRLLGTILLVIGLVLLVEKVGFWLDFAWLLPLGLILGGVIVLVKGWR